MWQNGDMDITFVIPKPWGDEPKEFAHIENRDGSFAVIVDILSTH